MIASSKEIIYFLEVCQTQNLSRASERLGISQPSLSHTIKRLEQSVGAQLFIRTKMGVVLTKAGQQLQIDAKQLLSLWQTVQAKSIASHEMVQGQYIFGCHASVARYCLPKFLPQLMDNYPQLEIKFTHDLSRKILEGIIKLQIDIGIVVNPIHHPDLILKKLYQDEVGFWRLRGYKEKSESMKNLNLICDPELAQSQTLLKALSKRKIIHDRLTMSSNLDVIAQLTASGVGWGILPKTVAMLHSELEEIQSMPTFLDKVYLVYRPEFKDIKAMQAIIQSVKSAFSLR